MKSLVNHIKNTTIVRGIRFIVLAAGLIVIGLFAAKNSFDAVTAVLCVVAFICGGIKINLKSPSSVRHIELDACSAVIIGAILSCGPVSAAGPAVMAALGRILLDFGHRDSFTGSAYTIARLPLQAALSGMAFSRMGGNTAYPIDIESLPAALTAAAIYTVLDLVLSGNIGSARARCLYIGIGYGIAGAVRSMPPYVFLIMTLPVAITLLSILSEARKACKTETAESQLGAEDKQVEEAKPSLIDPLTGLANRRYLEMFLHQEISRSERSGQPISVILIDIDNFRQLNDANGSESADRCLVAIGAGIKRMLREYDVVARYKDDEFVIVLPECDIDAASEAAHRLHSALSCQVLPLRAGFSAGVASYPAYGTSVDDLLSSAHHALNRAKFSGKNTIRSCHELAKAG